MKSFVFFWLPTAITWTCAVLSIWFLRKIRNYCKERREREAKFVARLAEVARMAAERENLFAAQLSEARDELLKECARLKAMSK